jgi:hypothetical protein
MRQSSASLVPGLFASVLQALAKTAPSMLETSEEESSLLDDASSPFRDGGGVHEISKTQRVNTSYTPRKATRVPQLLA